MKTHFDPMLKKQVMHGHDLEDIPGVYSLASGNLGALDASAGTLEDPIDPPASTKSGFWIITVAGYIDLDGVSTLFEAGDFLTFDLDSGEYARVDNKILDATLDISSTFTNSLAGALTNQKLVNERLDIYVPPAGSAAGSIPYWDGTKRLTSDPTKWKWDPATETMSFGNSGKVQIGDVNLYRSGTNQLKTDDGLTISGGLDVLSSVSLYANIEIRNKVNNGWLTFATRNTAGAEAVYDLAYVGNITMPYASTILATTGSMTVGTIAGQYLYFKTNNTSRWAVTGGGGFFPVTDNTNDIGGPGSQVKDLYLGGKIYIGGDVNLYRYAADVLKTDDGLRCGGSFEASGAITSASTLLHQGNIQTINKVLGGWLTWFTRNTAGAEVVGDLTYIGNITMPYASTIQTSFGQLTIGTIGASSVQFKANNADRWFLASTGHFLPNNTNNYDIGSSSYKVKDGFFAGTLYTEKINVATQTPASAGATGTAGTITWDSNFLYVCIAANTWKRAALSTW